MNIKNKVVVITGASSGLGEETAIQLSKRGAHIILVARSRVHLEKVKSKIQEITSNKSLTIECDISSEDEVENMITTIQKHYAHVDILINNAGVGKYIPSEQMSNQEIRTHFEVNVFGTIYCIKAILPLMKRQGEGYILNIASLFSLISFADVSVYAATKFALAGFTKGLHQELKRYNIKTGLLMPASINTPFQNKKVGNRKSPGFMILEPKNVANEIALMIRNTKKERILPKWITPFVRIKCLFS